jgi:hypothetical protein
MFAHSKQHAPRSRRPPAAHPLGLGVVAAVAATRNRLGDVSASVRLRLVLERPVLLGAHRRARTKTPVKPPSACAGVAEDGSARCTTVFSPRGAEQPTIVGASRWRLLVSAIRDRHISCIVASRGAWSPGLDPKALTWAFCLMRHPWAEQGPRPAGCAVASVHAL